MADATTTPVPAAEAPGPAPTVENRVQRQSLIKAISDARGGRCVVTLFTFDRATNPPIPFGTIQLREDVKQALFRVLKDSCRPGQGVDLCLYTRGGDVNSVWPIVSLLREFDPNFEVLIPYRAHSAGTLLALAARKIHMGPISELSPIDPTTANAFNPVDGSGSRMAISVEDVSSYMQFVRGELELLRPTGESNTEGKKISAPTTKDQSTAASAALVPFIEALTRKVHPLAIGNVERVHRQIALLARRLLTLHAEKNSGKSTDGIIQRLTSELGSHNHKISRDEAIEILGENAVVRAPSALADAMDRLLVCYDDHYKLSSSFSLVAWMQDQLVRDMRYIGAALESSERSYLFETKAVVRQSSALPQNIQVQLPPGQPVPIVPGLPRQFAFEVLSQRWMHNTAPLGVTV